MPEEEYSKLCDLKSNLNSISAFFQDYRRDLIRAKQKFADIDSKIKINAVSKIDEQIKIIDDISDSIIPSMVMKANNRINSYSEIDKS